MSKGELHTSLQASSAKQLLTNEILLINKFNNKKKKAINS